MVQFQFLIIHNKNLCEWNKNRNFMYDGNEEERQEEKNRGNNLEMCIKAYIVIRG